MARQYLHIGVFRAGKLVDERFAPLKGEVTVGRSAGNNIWLAGANVPEQHTLFTFDSKNPVLHVAAGMQGELALDGKAKQPLAAIQAKGKAETGGWAVELPDEVKGWVTLGDTTFFLQETERPKPPPKSTLPAHARSGWFSGMDQTFTRVFASVFAVELAFFLFVNSRPHIAPEAPLPEDDPDRFAEVVVPPKEQPKEEAKGEEEEKKEDKKEDKKEEKKADADPEKKAAAHADAVKKAVASSKLLQVLGATGGSGALANVFASGKGFGADVASALDGAGGVKIANGDDGPEHKGSAGGDGAVGIGDLGSAAGGGGGGHGHLGEKKAITPVITFDNDDVEVEGTSVDKDALGKFIRTRLRSIQSCYEKELKLNPSLKGKIVVRFTITAAGRTGECGIDSDSMHDDNVANCIVRLIRAWVYPFKQDDDVPVTFPFVFQPGG